MAKVLKKSRWISLALITVVLTTLAIVPFFSKSKASWSPGPLTSAHRTIQKDCQSCHDGNFSKVRDEKCLQCHQLSSHAKSSMNFEPRCVDCHHEHTSSPEQLLKDSRLCLDCHQSKDSLAKHSEKNPTVHPVPNFQNHPEIQNQAPQSKLKYDHKIHLRPDLETKDSTRKLICTDCHELINGFPRLKEMKFEKLCRDCHRLTFDDGFPSIEAPHKTPDEVFSFLSNIYRTKTPSPITLDRSRRPGRQTEKLRPRNARDAERLLVLQTGCNLCHYVSEKSGVVAKQSLAEGKSLFTVLPIKLQDHESKMNLNIHRTHQGFKCVSCHPAAASSKKSEDNLYPKMKTCSTCHADQKSDDQIPSACPLCHSYHRSLPLPPEKVRKIQEEGP